MKLRKPQRWVMRLTLGLAVAAIAAPGSLAAGANPAGAPPADAFDSGVPGGGYIPVEAIPTPPAPAEIFKSGVPGGGYTPTVDPEGTAAADQPSGFDWQILAVGLGAGLAGVFAGAAAAFAIRRNSTPARL